MWIQFIDRMIPKTLLEESQDRGMARTLVCAVLCLLAGCVVLPLIASVINEAEAVEWACRSIDFAFSFGVEVCSVIPVRSGNGALDRMALDGYFGEPSIYSLEQVLDYGLGLKKGLVFADLWDLERFSTCKTCFGSRKERLMQANLTQKPVKPLSCNCGVSLIRNKSKK